jgi:hypothetical protein
LFGLGTKCGSLEDQERLAKRLEISDTVDVTLDSDISQKWLAVRIME